MRIVDTTPKSWTSNWARRLSRVPSLLQALTVAATVRGTGRAYLIVDADAGMYHTILCAALARVRGYQVVLHHHNYSYIAQRTPRMKLLMRAAGADAVHVTLCGAMSRELRQQYRGVRYTLELSNAYTLRDSAEPKVAPLDRFTLGHLSSLRVEKGLTTAISCLRLLRQAGVDAMLRLAGPAADDEAAAIIEAAKPEFQGALVHDGPVYGEAKDEFYRTISVFLFPTEYRNETQGIVNLEALAAGTPVVAYGRCCIPHDIGEGGGLVVPTNAAFEEVALPQLLHWANDPAALHRASIAARRRFEQLREESEMQLAGLLRVLRPAAEPELACC